VYDVFTEPYYLSPYAKIIKSKAEGWISVFLTMVNTSYLWFEWFLFMSFPEEERRFAVVAVGTIYPIAASTIALTTKTDASDDAFWLSYCWSGFSLLFLAMDYLENFVGGLPDFYSICLVTTIYLFLPILHGANVVFRRVWVPLTGQYENMLLHDAYLVRKDMEKSIPSKYHERVFRKATDVFVASKRD